MADAAAILPGFGGGASSAAAWIHCIALEESPDMARKTASRLQKRREVEAAGTTPETKKAKAEKKPAKKRTTRRKAKVPDRKRLFWGVFSGTLKEEGRFTYDQYKQAEEKLELLRSKSKKLYFIQPIKEVISGETAAAPEEPAEAPKPRPSKAKVVADVDDDEEADDEDDEE